MIICKFGGTSLADGAQIKKAVAIMHANRDRAIMVVSAPGKRHAEDHKVTDRLYHLAELAYNRLDTSDVLLDLFERLSTMVAELALSDQLAASLSRELLHRLSRSDLQKRPFYDQIVAYGEWASATIVYHYLHALGQPARLVDPVQAGLLLHEQGGYTIVDDFSYHALKRSLLPRSEQEIIIFPGFYGGDEYGQIITFSRGGSDITGSVVAAGVDADLYENWSDVDHVYVVNPQLVNDPCPIYEMSYREMRELAYLGFTIVHPDALQPVFAKKIPIEIKNTNRPEISGTRIVAERSQIAQPVTGIAAADDFCAISLRRVLANRQIGILAGILGVFAEEGVAIEHAPTGIDSVSIVVREENLPHDKEARIVSRLTNELGFSQPTVARNLSSVMLVGEGMLDAITVVSRAAEALANQKISVEVMLQDYYEISILFMMSEAERERAVPALYAEFFGQCPAPLPVLD